MSRKSASKTKEETSKDGAEDTSGVNMADMTRLLEEQKASILEDFRKLISPLETKVDRALSTVENHETRIESLETAANSESDRIQKLETDYAELATKYEKLNKTN